jgi:hypothetical protein
MGRRAGALASSSIFAGLFLGIYLYTGISIDPMDLLSTFARELTGKLAPEYSSLIGTTFAIMAIVGVWQTCSLIISGFKFRILGLAMTVAGFVGGMTLFYSPIIGLILMVVSIVFGKFL